MTVLLKLLRLVRPFTWWIILAIIAGFATIGSSIGLLMTAAWLLSKAALHPSFHELQIAIVGVRFFGIARGALRYIERLVAHSTTFRLLSNIRVWFYASLEPLAPARLQQYKSADLLQRIVGDIDTLENLYARVIAPPATAMMISGLLWMLLGYFSWEISLTVLLFHGAAALVIPLISGMLNRGSALQLSRTKAHQQAATIDYVQGMAELQLFGQVDRHLETMQAQKQKELKIQRKQALIQRAHEPLIGLCMNAAVITVLWKLGPLVTSGAIESIWTAVIVVGIMASFEAFLPLPDALQHLETDIEAGKRIFDIIDTEPAVTTPPHPIEFPSDHSVSFSNVTFCYPGSAIPALRNMSFDARHGEKTAIVGPSGSGKSTITSLLLRFYNTTEGNITIGGTSLQQMDPDIVRRNISIVSQKTYLFAETIRQNLLLGNPQANDQQLASALQQAGIGAFARKLDQWAGQHGMQLSGGERQRIAIARTILQQAPLIMLDEATASLDTITEKKVMEEMISLTHNKTLLVITHKLQAMEQFDRIIVLDRGTIVEEGSHQDLLQQKGIYSSMWKLQHETVIPDIL